MRRKKTEEKELGNMIHKAVSSATVQKLCNGKYVVLGRFKAEEVREVRSSFGRKHRCTYISSVLLPICDDPSESVLPYDTVYVQCPACSFEGKEPYGRFHRSSYASCWVDTKKEAEKIRLDYLASLGSAYACDCHA